MPIDIVEPEAFHAAVVRGQWPLVKMRDAQQEARAALDAALAGRETGGGPRLTVWRMLGDATIDYAPGVVVDASFVASDPVSLWSPPRGRAAHLRHTGGYEGLPAAWQALFSACAAQGLKPAGPNWEIYGDAGGATDLYALLSD